MKLGVLSSTELHTEQLLEGVAKLLANYSWCIEEISNSPPALITLLFNFEVADFEELLNKAMHVFVVKNYLTSSKADREGNFKKKTYNQI